MTDKELEEGLAENYNRFRLRILAHLNAHPDAVGDCAFLLNKFRRDNLAFFAPLIVVEAVNIMEQYKAALAYLREQGFLMEWRPIAELTYPHIDDSPLKINGKSAAGIAESDYTLLSDGRSVWKGQATISLKTDELIEWAGRLPTHFMPLPKPPTNDKE